MPDQDDGRGENEIHVWSEEEIREYEEAMVVVRSILRHQAIWGSAVKDRTDHVNEWPPSSGGRQGGIERWGRSG